MGDFDFDVGAGVLAVVDAVADADADLHRLAVVVELARADGDDLALGRLFLGRIGQQDAALGLLFRLGLFHDHAILKGSKFHVSRPRSFVSLAASNGGYKLIYR